MRPQVLTERETYERHPLAFEVPAVALLVLLMMLAQGQTAILVGEHASALFDMFEPWLAVQIARAGSLVSSIGMPALVAVWYLTVRDIDVSVSLPSGIDRHYIATVLAVPVVLVGAGAIFGVGVGRIPFWVDERLTAGDALYDVVGAVFSSAMIAALYHGAIQGTFDSITDAHRGLILTIAVVSPLFLVEFVWGLPLAQFGAVSGNAVVKAGVFCVAAWAYDRTGTLLVPALAYLSMGLAGVARDALITVLV